MTAPDGARAGTLDTLAKAEPESPTRLRLWRTLIAVATWGALNVVLLSYLSASGRSSAPTWHERCAIVLVSLLAVLFLGFWTRRFASDTYRHTGRLCLLAILIPATMFAVAFFLPFSETRTQSLTILFWSASALVLAVLVSPNVALAATITEGLLIGLASAADLTLILPGIFSCFAAIVAADHLWPPSRLARAIGLLAAANAVIALIFSSFSNLTIQEIFRESVIAFTFGVLAPPLALGLVFLLQRPFDITNHVLLLELSNPNEPLLHRLQHEAPGTYYSSVIVANLAEAAAESIGANALLARVGALYHDIGKLRHPELFSENQFLLGAQNIHATLSPSLSTLVILAHVRDGVELGRRYGLPQSIRDIIEEHHGTTMVSFFYHQARMRQPGPPPPEKRYRYEGRCPRTKESAIVMLADALQAAAKSLPDPSLERLESLVQEIVLERQQDGQLKYSALTFNELTRISQSFLHSLQGLHLHTRVQYPAAMRIVPEDAEETNASTDESSHPQPPEPADSPRRYPAHRSGGHAS